MLSKKQQAFYDILQKYFIQHSESPTIEELQKIIGLKSKRGVVQYLEALERKGYITRDHNIHRSIKLQKVNCADIIHIKITGVVRDFI